MMHKSFCISLGRPSAELRDTLLSAWSQVRICSITHDIGHLSPVSPLSPPALTVHRPRESWGCSQHDVKKPPVVALGPL